MKKYLILLREISTGNLLHFYTEADSFEYAMYKAKNETKGYEIIGSYIEHQSVREYIGKIMENFKSIYENA